MTKDEAYEVINESIGSTLCLDCPYYIVGHDKVDESDFPLVWRDCMVDNPHFCPYVQAEEQAILEEELDG
jgi:hypothetical protein